MDVNWFKLSEGKICLTNCYFSLHVPSGQTQHYRSSPTGYMCKFCISVHIPTVFLSSFAGKILLSSWHRLYLWWEWSSDTFRCNATVRQSTMHGWVNLNTSLMHWKNYFKNSFIPLAGESERAETMRRWYIRIHGYMGWIHVLPHPTSSLGHTRSIQCILMCRTPNKSNFTLFIRKIHTQDTTNSLDILKWNMFK